MLGEKMMLHGWSGVAFLVLGIGLVATDPGEKVQEGGDNVDDDAPPLLIIWIGPALICACAMPCTISLSKSHQLASTPYLVGAYSSS
jgi:drug/metabolite transporter (DMT)-like permease